MRSIKLKCEQSNCDIYLTYYTTTLLNLPVTYHYRSQQPITHHHCSQRPVTYHCSSQWPNQWSVFSQWLITDQYFSPTTSHWSPLLPITGYNCPSHQSLITTVPTHELCPLFTSNKSKWFHSWPFLSCLASVPLTTTVPLYRELGATCKYIKICNNQKKPFSLYYKEILIFTRINIFHI